MQDPHDGRPLSRRAALHTAAAIALGAGIAPELTAMPVTRGPAFPVMPIEPGPLLRNCTIAPGGRILPAPTVTRHEDGLVEIDVRRGRARANLYTYEPGHHDHRGALSLNARADAPTRRWLSQGDLEIAPDEIDDVIDALQGLATELRRRGFMPGGRHGR